MSDAPTDSDSNPKIAPPAPRVAPVPQTWFVQILSQQTSLVTFVLILLFGSLGGLLVSLQPSDPLLPAPLCAAIQALFGASAAVVGCYIIMDVTSVNRGRIMAAALVFGFCGIVVFKQARTAVGLSGSDTAKGQVDVVAAEAATIEKHLDSATPDLTSPAYANGNTGLPLIQQLGSDAVNLMALGSASGDEATQHQANAHVMAICSKLQALSRSYPTDVQSTLGPISDSVAFYRISGLQTQLKDLQAFIGSVTAQLPPVTDTDFVYVRWLNLVKTSDGTYSAPLGSSLFNTTPSEKIPSTVYDAALKHSDRKLSLPISSFLQEGRLAANTTIYVRATFPSTGGLNWPILGQSVGTLAQDTVIQPTAELITEDDTKNYAQVWLRLKKDNDLKALPATPQ
jgi:hypothetical protein